MLLLLKYFFRIISFSNNIYSKNSVELSKKIHTFCRALKKFFMIFFINYILQCKHIVCFLSFFHIWEYRISCYSYLFVIIYSLKSSAFSVKVFYINCRKSSLYDVVYVKRKFKDADVIELLNCARGINCWRDWEYFFHPILWSE